MGVSSFSHAWAKENLSLCEVEEKDSRGGREEILRREKKVGYGLGWLGTLFILAWAIEAP